MPAIVRLHFLKPQIHSSNPTLALARTTIWTEIQLHYSVIAAVSYCFRSFTSAVSTRYGSVAIDFEAFEETKGKSGIVLSNIHASRKSSKAKPTTLGEDEFVGYTSKSSRSITISGGPRNDRSTERRRSGESTVVIIQEEMHVESGRATPASEEIGFAR